MMKRLKRPLSEAAPAETGDDPINRSHQSFILRQTKILTIKNNDKDIQ
jgi:hypothetical protein